MFLFNLKLESKREGFILFVLSVQTSNPHHLIYHPPPPITLGLDRSRLSFKSQILEES